MTSHDRMIPSLRSSIVFARYRLWRRTLAAAALTGLSVAACGKGAKGGNAADAKPGPDAPAVVGARTAIAARQPFTESVHAIGTVAARPGHVASLSAPAATRVTQIFVVPGQRVAAGAPLVEFDRAPFDAQARSTEAALTSAEHAYERAKRLTDAGILARKDLDQASTDLAQAQANDVAARRAQAFATLRSPIAGVVTRLTAVLSASADPSQPIVEVADPAALDILLTVSPSDAARVRRGAAVSLTAGQQASGESLGTGTIADVAATVDTTSRGVLVRARIAHAARPLRIGETVFGRITVGERPNAVTVPLAALVPDAEGFKVFVLDSAHMAHATTVTVGGRTDQVAEITSGLAGGETVVTTGAYGVEDSVQVVPMAPAAVPAASTTPSTPSTPSRPGHP